VNYPAATWACLLHAFTEFTSSDRSQLIDDAFSISMAGLLGPSVPLSFALGLDRERSIAVWSPALEHLDKLATLLQDQPTTCLNSLQALISSIVAPSAEQLGWQPIPGESHLDGLLRMQLLMAAVLNANQAAIQAARQLFALGPEAYPSELQLVVLTAAIRYGGAAEFEAILQMYREASFAPEKIRILSALASSRNTTALHGLLAMAIGPDVRPQDTVKLVAAVFKHPKGKLLTWEWMKQHWDILDHRYGSGGFAITHLIRMLQDFSSQARLDDINNFFRDNPVPAAQRELARVQEEISGSMRWVAHSATPVCAWLAQNIG